MLRDDRFKSCVQILVFFSVVLLALPNIAEQHWSPYTMPESIPEGAKTHVIVKGDTLWDLAGKYLDNPYLWPQIWEANRYITDPHWIYPGDVLVIPLVEPIEEEVVEVSEVSEEPAEEETGRLPGEAGVEEIGEVTETAEVEEVAPIAPGWKASLTEVYCSPLIPDKPLPEDLRFIGNEEDSVSSTTGEIVYLSQGENQGISAGDMFFILHNARMIRNPLTDKDIGNLYLRSGELKVIAVQENTATARITFACQEI